MSSSPLELGYIGYIPQLGEPVRFVRSLDEVERVQGNVVYALREGDTRPGDIVLWCYMKGRWLARIAVQITCWDYQWREVA